MTRWSVFLLLTLACSEKAGEPAPGQDAGPSMDAGPQVDVGPPGPVVERLQVFVDDPVLNLQQSTPIAARAFGTGLPEDGREVTDRVRWSVTPEAAGSISNGRLTASLSAGPVVVRAQLEGLEASAEITVRFEATETRPVDGRPAVPEDPAAVFEGAQPDPGRTLDIFYPSDETLLPRNLGQLEVHFEAGDHELYRLEFESSTVSVVVYTRCEALGAGCIFPLERNLYRRLSDAAAGRDPVTLRVVGTDGESSSASGEIRVSFSAETVEGGLYYWTTSDEAIMRVDFGAGNEPERFFPEDSGHGTCFGCHALSPNGERMTLSREGQNNGELYLLDVQTREIILDGLETDQREQFQSWAPDSSRFAAIWADASPPDTHIRIRSGETGRVLEQIPLGHEPTHPDWSPAGDQIAYTRVTQHKTSQRPERGGISSVRALEGGGWSTPIEWIAPEDGFNYYNPAFGLDGSFLLYNRSVCPDGRTGGNACDGDADPSAQLWAIDRPGGRRIRLDRANAPGLLDGSSQLTNTFPRWAPFEGPRFRDGEGRVWWMTFSSRRRYGLRQAPGNGQLLWMAAVDPDAILEGRDGSYPAFALPFQDLSTSNHIGQWTRRVVPADPDPPGPDPEPACQPRGASCDVGGADPCCGGLFCDERGVCAENI